MAENERYQRGLDALEAIGGAASVAGLVNLRTLAPDLSRYTIEAFGDIYANPTLDVKTREIATVAALTALGTARPQLRVHIQNALNVGCTRQEIVEVITQMFAYAGFPAALNGMDVARDVF